MDVDIIRNDENLPMNAKYRPDVERYGTSFMGYKNWNQQVFFYELAVQNADVSFSYHGQEHFYLLLIQSPLCGGERQDMEK